MHRRVRPTPHALALAAEREAGASTISMARKQAIALAGLTMAILAMAAAVGGSLGHRALGSTTTVASALTR